MRILNTHPTFVNSNDIEQICQPLKSLGIDYFSHVMIDNKEQFSAIGTCPQFAELYFKKKYYNFDIHRSPLHQGQHYTLWDDVERDPEMNAVYEDFQGFSLGHSFTISHQDIEGNAHYYDFSATLGNGDINYKYLQHLDTLKHFILYFNEQINSDKILKKAHDIKIIMTDNKNNIKQKQTFDNLPVTRIYLTPNIYLTIRELQCLHELSQGKTIEEVSQVLSITPRTMKAHIKNMKNKLGCESIFQLGVVYQSLIREHKNFIEENQSCHE